MITTWYVIQVHLDVFGGCWMSGEDPWPRQQKISNSPTTVLKDGHPDCDPLLYMTVYLGTWYGRLPVDSFGISIC